MKHTILTLLLGLLLFNLNAQEGKGLYKRYQIEAENKPVSIKTLSIPTNEIVHSLDLSNYYSQYELFEKNEVAITELQEEQPDILHVKIAGTNSNVLKFYKKDIRDPNMLVRTSTGEAFSNWDDIIFYRGYVDGYPNSIAVLTIFEEDYKIMYSFGEGNNWLHATKDDLYIHYNDRNFLVPSPGKCEIGKHPELYKDVMEENIDAVEEENRAGTGDFIPMYIECDNDSYTKNGSSIIATANWAMATCNEVITLYCNDDMNVYVAEIKIWNCTDPYASLTSTLDMLYAFDNLGGDYKGRHAHLFSTRNVGGGIAWSGASTLCNPSYSYAVSGSMSSSNPPSVPSFSWNVEVVAHEMGHNIGSPHTHACFWNNADEKIDECGDNAGYPETGSLGSCSNTPGEPAGGGTIMSYCHLTATGIDFANGFSDGDGSAGNKSGPRSYMQDRIANASASCLTPTASLTCDNTSNCGTLVCPDCISNDECSGALDITSLINGGSASPATMKSNFNALSGTATPTLGHTGTNTFGGWSDNTNRRDVWYKLTVPAGSEPMGLLRVSTLGSCWDTQVAIWEGGCGSGTTPPTTFISANDDFHGAANNNNSLTTAMVVPGNEYFIQLDGKTDDDRGDVVFDIIYTPITQVESRAGTVMADWEGRDANGWTHYVNTTNGSLLLSVEKGSQDIGWVGIDASTCEVKGNTGYTNLGSSAFGCGCPYLINQIDWVVTNRTWDLNPITQPSAPMNIRSYYGPMDLSDMSAGIVAAGYAAATEAAVTHYKVDATGDEDLTAGGNACHGLVSSASYSEFDPGSYVAGTYGTGHYGEFPVPSFSGGGAGIGNDALGALPVSLVDFYGEIKTRFNRLNWTTSSEINNEFMIVEKSLDAYNDWTEVGRVEGNIFSDALNEYSVDDMNPSIKTYYRLKIVDIDGKTDYSDIIVLRRNDDLSELSFSIYPVPSSDNVSIQVNGTTLSDYELTIHSINGKHIETRTIKAGINGLIELNIRDFENGIYLVTLNNNDFTEVLKFTKI